MIRLGINGFGRIGRQVLKAVLARYPESLQVVAVNDLFDVETNAHLFKYDTNYGRYRGEGRRQEGQLHHRRPAHQEPGLSRSRVHPLGRRGGRHRDREHRALSDRSEGRRPPPGRRQEGDHHRPRQGGGPDGRHGGQSHELSARRSTISSPTPPARRTASPRR